MARDGWMAMRGRTRWWVAGATIAVLVLEVRAGWPQRSAEEAIFPIAEYKAQDGRVLAPAHLGARKVIHADARVGGYGLVLTWVKPPASDPPIGETLVVFLPKSAVTAFVSGTATFTELLAQARIRAFDGQTEVRLTGLAIPDQELPVRPPPC